MRFKDWCVIVVAVVGSAVFFTIIGLAVIGMDENCHGVLVKNFWGLPECIER